MNNVTDIRTEDALANGKPVQAEDFYDLMDTFKRGNLIAEEIDKTLQANLTMTASLLRISILMYVNEYPEWKQTHGDDFQKWCGGRLGFHWKQYNKASQELRDAGLWSIPEELS